LIDLLGMKRRLYRDRAGIAGIEFALVAPAMVLMLLTTFELMNAERVQAKLNLAAGQLAEMIAAQSSVTEGSPEGPGGTLGDFCTAASYDMLPYDPSKLSGWMESTTVGSGGGTAQNWANDKSCPAANAIGSFWETIDLTTISDTPRSMFTLDGTPKGSGGQTVPGYSAITVQLTYTYTNILPHLLQPFVTFTAVGSARPRSNTTIPCTYPSGSGTAACPGVY
jgi:Flp pilus assembly protein TadG